MPNYKGRRPNTRRVVIWHQGKPLEWTVEGGKADGDKFESRKRLELQVQGEARRGAVRFSRLCEEYTLHAETHLKESTWKKSRIYMVATLIEHFGQLKIDAITAGNVDAYKRKRLDVVKPSTVNSELRVFRTILAWGRLSGYLIPELKIRKVPVRGNDRVQFWAKEELDKIFESTRILHPYLLPMFVFLANTGCRKGEALALEWPWINWDENIVTIYSTEEWQPKSNRSRDVPISDAVRAVLSGPRLHRTIVFPTHRGHRRYKEFPKDIFWEILKHAGVAGNPHMFRHTFAANFLAATKDIQLLAKILGHSALTTTEIYAHLLPGALERAKNAVNLAPKTMALTMAEGTRKRTKARKTG